jgi:hypothetical protein
MHGMGSVNVMTGLDHLQQDEFKLEIRRAEESLRAGNQGRMRVCARRAAGVLLRVWMQQNGIQSPYADVYRSIEFLLPLFKDQVEIKTILAHLVARVDEDYNSPVDVDYIQDVFQLAKLLGLTVEEGS